MSAKLFCDVCGNEVSLPGNDYSASNLTFNRTLSMQLNGWKMIIHIHRETEGKDADLCRKCTIELANRALNTRREEPRE